MNPSEAAELLGVAATFDRRTVGESDAVAWAAALHDITLDDAKRAVVEHYRESREWIMPADVRRRVKAAREARMARHAVPPPPPELADRPAEYRAALKRDISRLADGWGISNALTPAKGSGAPSAAYTRARGDAPHRRVRVEAMRVHCPHCHAAAGDQCVNALGKPLTTQPAHDARLVAAGLAHWVQDGGHRHARLNITREGEGTRP